MSDSYGVPVVHVTRRQVGADETVQAQRAWWDAAAPAYQAEHGDFLRDDGFIWSPEGLDEASIGLLGEAAGRRVLEVGCGAAQCTRWLVGQGAAAVGIDISVGQLAQARLADRRSGVRAPVALADVMLLPFAAESFDLVCSAFGALPFVGDVRAALTEVARVLRPDGRFVWSVPHPMRWCFPDDPGPDGLVASISYFDRVPYVEEDAAGAVSYVEHHRTMGDWVRAIAGAWLRLDDVLEPSWPEHNQRIWGQWSPLRGEIMPGSAVFVTTRGTAQSGT